MGLWTRAVEAWRFAAMGAEVQQLVKMAEEGGISWADQLRLFRADKQKDSVFYKLTTVQQLQMMRNNVVVYACVSTKARAFQQPPLIVEAYDAGEDTWNPQPNSPLLEPFRNNPDLSENDIKQYISMHLNLTGKCFLWEWTDALGNVRELWPIPPSWVTINLVQSIPTSPTSQRIIESYTVNPDGSGTGSSKGTEWTVPAEEMTYIRFPNPENLWDGLSPVVAASKSIQLDNKGEEYKGEAMDSLRLPGVVVKTKKPLNQRQKDDLRAVLKQKVGGDARENAVLISGDEAALELLNPMKDYDWSGYSDLNETRICMAFGVPPVVIGSWVGLKNSPWSNTGEAKRWMYQNTMMGEWELVSVGITRGLVVPKLRNTLRIVFDLSDVKELRDDAEVTWKRAREAWEAGLLTRNQALELMGYGTEEDGDVYKLPATAILLPAGMSDMMSPAGETELTPEEQEEGVAAMEQEAEEEEAQ